MFYNFILNTNEFFFSDHSNIVLVFLLFNTNFNIYSYLPIRYFTCNL